MLAGFKCPLNGENVTFEHCFSKCSNLCKHPLPVLMALKNDRAIKKDTISVTQILQPLQIHFLKAQHDYFVSPDDMMFATFGSAWHLLVANETQTLQTWGRKHEFSIEDDNYFCAPIVTPKGVAYLEGTPDLYLPHKHILYDFKTIKFYYTLKYIIEKGWNEADTNYHWQINLYRHWKYPDTKEMRLYGLVKDWNRQLKQKYDIDPTVSLTVPFIDDKEVNDFTVERLTEFLEIQNGDKPMPPCPDKDLWIQKDGTRLRCEEYCVVKDVCPQYKAYKEAENEKAKSLRVS